MSNCNWSLANVEATSEHWWVTHTVERNMRTKQWCHILSSNTSIIVTWGLEFVCVRCVFERRGFCGGGVRGREGGGISHPAAAQKWRKHHRTKIVKHERGEWRGKSWEKEEKWEGIWTGCICPGTWDLNSAHGGLAVLPSVSFLCSFENLSTSMSHVVCKFTGLGSAGCVWL